MLEGNRIILNNTNLGELQLSTAPEGLFNMEYSLSRSQKFWGVFPSYSGRLGFSKEGKTYIDSALDNYNKYEEITFTWYVRDPETAIYETFIEGIINLKNYNRQQLYTYVDFEGTSIEMKLNSRMDIEVPYYRLESFDGTVLPGFTYDYVNLKCQGFSSDIITKSIYPHELIESIIQQILDLDYSCLYSQLLGRTNISYPENGDLSKKMITKGTFMRGLTDYLYISLSQAFDIFDKIRPCGLGFDEDSQGRDIIVFADREYFFQNIVVFEFDNNKISNLNKEFGDEFSFNEIEIGFEKSVKKDVQYGLSEYNVKSSYSTNSIFENKKLELINAARADGVAINDIIDNYQAVGTEGSDYDEDIFIIDSDDETGVGYDMVNLKDENYTSYEGIEGDPGLNYNFDLSPARILIKYWGKWLNITLQELSGYLKYNKAETLSNLRTLRDDDTESIYEKQDIFLSILETPIMTGNILYFDYPLTEAEIKTIKNNFYGQGKFWDYSEKKYNGGWFKNVNVNSTEGKATFEIYEAISLGELIGYKLTMEGGYKLTMEGGFKRLLN